MTGRVVWFEVPGRPAQQGSKRIGRHRYTRRPIILEDNDEAKDAWRALIVQYASLRAPGVPLDGPLEARVVFRFAMPKSRRAAHRRAGVRFMDVVPDVDKLTRNLHDGLKDAGVISDDSRIVMAGQLQLEVGPPCEPGVTVIVREITDAEVLALRGLGPRVMLAPLTFSAIDGDTG